MEATAEVEHGADEAVLVRKLHQTIKKVTIDYERFHFNTAIAAVMELMNAYGKYHDKPARSASLEREVITTVVKLLHPMAPHATEELWEQFGNEPSLLEVPWPPYSPELAREEMVTVVVQVNGKLRDQITVPESASKEEILAAARLAPRAAAFLDGKDLRREPVYVPKKLVNFVVG